MDPSVSFVSQRDQDLLVNHLTASEVAIFLFHGVTAEKSVGIRNYTGKHVQLDDFSQLMHALAQVGSPISMDEAYRSLTGQAQFPLAASSSHSMTVSGTI